MSRATELPGVEVDRALRFGGAVATVTLCNSKRLNVLDSRLIQAMHAALTSPDAQAARVVVLRGAGERAWVGGADIGEMAGLDTSSARDFITRLHELCHAVRHHQAPVIALINGYCLGAGLELAACCDLRLAVAGSQFGMPEVQVGIPSVIEAAVLPRLIGAGRARDLVLTGRLIDANTAVTWGLVELAPDTEAVEKLLGERIEQLVNAGPQAIRAQKDLCRTWEERPLSDAIRASIDTFAAAYAHEEPRERMQHFLNRKKRGLSKT